MNYFEKIDEICKAGVRAQGSIKEPHEFSITRHLFELMGEENTNMMLDSLIDYCIGKELEFEEFFTMFHESFRQTDVFDNGHLDMVFHNFIYISRIPQRVMEEIYEDKQA